MHASGKYNTGNLGQIFAVGVGTDNSNRADAFWIDYSGNSTFNYGLTVLGDTNLENLVVNQDLTVQGTTNLENLVVNQDLTVVGDTSLDGDITINGGLDITDDIDMNDLYSVVNARQPQSDSEMLRADSYAQETLGGSVKMRLDLSDPTKPILYMSNDGTNP